MTDAPETFTGAEGETRLRNTEIVVPIVVGTAAFHLGKKAVGDSSHRWTAYVRSNDNEDISHIIQKVVFTLHASFANPTRELPEPPYEVTEHGWGEFEIVVELYFAEDSWEPPVQLIHKLKLLGEDGQPSKRAVVHEQLEELIFSEPVQAFHQRVTNQVKVPAPPYSVAQCFTNFAHESEVNRYNGVRKKVAQIRANLQRQLDVY